MKLGSKTVIVTGGGRGIGRATALAFAREGANVAITSRTNEQLESVKKEIEETGVQAAAFKADVAVESDCKRVIERTLSTFGQIDILVNNAGIFLPASVLSSETQDFDYMLGVNLRGPYVLCKETLKHMVPRESGTIINVSSTAGVKGYKGQGGYCASKHGLVGLTRVLAEEMRPFNIRVHAICPGGVDTQLVTEDHPNPSLKPIDMMQPEDVAELILYIACMPAKATIEEVVLKRFGEEFRKGKEED